ncbi:MAG: hypothetical protein WBM02_10450 [bacterium]
MKIDGKMIEMATSRIPYIEIKEHAQRHRFTWSYVPAIPHEADRSTKRGKLCRSNHILFKSTRNIRSSMSTQFQQLPSYRKPPGQTHRKILLINKEIRPECSRKVYQRDWLIPQLDRRK